MNKLVNLAQIVIYANTREFFVNRDRTEGIHNLLPVSYTHLVRHRLKGLFAKIKSN